jgi:hypothetical protein
VQRKYIAFHKRAFRLLISLKGALYRRVQHES